MCSTAHAHANHPLAHNVTCYTSILYWRFMKCLNAMLQRRKWSLEFLSTKQKLRTPSWLHVHAMGSREHWAFTFFIRRVHENNLPTLFEHSLSDNDWIVRFTFTLAWKLIIRLLFLNHGEFVQRRDIYGAQWISQIEIDASCYIYLFNTQILFSVSNYTGT